jgi:hypothetical protein
MILSTQRLRLIYSVIAMDEDILFILGADAIKKGDAAVTLGNSGTNCF